MVVPIKPGTRPEPEILVAASALRARSPLIGTGAESCDTHAEPVP
jgi:hypothetical protein